MKHLFLRLINLSSPVFILVLTTGCGGGVDYTDTPGGSLADLKHSHIILMPGGVPEDFNVLQPLNPSVVAWGNDPVQNLDNLESFRKTLDSYREVGVVLQASNAWMLTATGIVLHDDPRYQEAVCMDIGGIPIVPPWLDGEYKGVPSYWGCSNHPLFRAQVKERVIAGISSGANMLHVDDHLGTYASSLWAGGCFCEYCMEGFRIWLTEKISDQELRTRGIEDPGSFNYADLVRAQGITTREEYKTATGSGRIPLREEFLDFQREAAAAFIGYLGTVADSTAGKDIPVGVNAYNLQPTQLSTSHNADYFSNEVQHYGHEDSIPPLTFMLGTALGKPVFATASGVDWVNAQLDKSVTRVQRWIATAYSFGHYFMYAYKQWGFTEETGTIWYQVPISIYEPLCHFITENAELFDDYEAVAQVGLLYDNAACEEGDWWVREVCRELNYANIPTGLAVSGDKHLKFSTPPEKLAEFEWLLVPQGTDQGKSQNELFETALEQGKLLEWTGMDELLTRIDPILTLTNGEKVWALPRQKKATNGTELVIHLLNQDYDPDSDSMNRKTDVEVFISQRLIGGIPADEAWIFAPGTEPVELEVVQTEGGVKIKVPVLDLWAILKTGPVGAINN